LQAVVADLGEHYGCQAILCEGGPTLLRELVAEGLLDDLFLTVAPLLIAGDAPAALTGPFVDPPAPLELRGVHRGGDHVFLHYGARA
jgi:riboflavin biosynthesis pyrimidine reductase